MLNKHIITILALCAAGSAIAQNLPDDHRQISASQSSSAIISSVTQTSPGRYRIIGSVVDRNNTLACGLALASGRCVFSCGPGSPRCEGGTDNLSFGGFDLFDLPTEKDGTIIVQIFVQGNMPGLQVINPGGGGGQARWTAFTSTCCPTSSTVYSVTVEGVTKTSVSTRCDDPTPTTQEPFAIISPGLKNFTTFASSACAETNVSGTVEFSANSCYRFNRVIENGGPVTYLETVSCPSSANANVLHQADSSKPVTILPENLTGNGAASATPEQPKIQP